MPAQESCADRGDGKFAIPNSDVFRSRNTRPVDTSAWLAKVPLTANYMVAAWDQMVLGTEKKIDHTSLPTAIVSQIGHTEWSYSDLIKRDPHLWFSDFEYNTLLLRGRKGVFVFADLGTF